MLSAYRAIAILLAADPQTNSRSRKFELEEREGGVEREREREREHSVIGNHFRIVPADKIEAIEDEGNVRRWRGA